MPITGRGAWLTAAGRELVRALRIPRALQSLRLPELYDFIERAIRVEREYARDREYVVVDDKVVIVDEGTGRPSPGRQWAEGIHQAVEAREGLPLSPETETLARVTLQEFFGRFRGLSGMTGTARSAAAELRRVYRFATEIIPTRLPSRRMATPPRVFVDAAAKWRAVAADASAAHAANRPVLVGTRRVEDSRHASAQLAALGVPHTVLNATQMADEAEIIARAGQPGCVTIATNMAGRGTDIRLGPGVAEAGDCWSSRPNCTNRNGSIANWRTVRSTRGPRRGADVPVHRRRSHRHRVGVAAHRRWQARAARAADRVSGELSFAGRWWVSSIGRGESSNGSKPASVCNWSSGTRSAARRRGTSAAASTPNDFDEAKRHSVVSVGKRSDPWWKS